MDEQELIKKKKEIEDAKLKLAKLSGQKQALLQQMKDDWDCDNLTDAKKKIEEFKNLNKELEMNIKKATQTLEDEFFNKDNEDA